MSESDLLIDEYLTHLKVERGLGPATVQAYATDLARYARHLDAEAGDVVSADGGAISGFLYALSKGGLSARSQARYLSSLRGLYKYLLAEKHVARDPTELVDGPRLAKKLPVVLSKSEVLSLLRAPRGTMRRFRPMPNACTNPVSRFTSPSSRFTSSETRSPAASVSYTHLTLPTKA